MRPFPAEGGTAGTMRAIFLDRSGTSRPSQNRAAPEKQTGKFVQLRNGDREYLVFSPTSITPYHGDILERFCRDREIAGVYDGGKRRFDIRDPAWIITGGGKYEIDRGSRRIRLYDDSMAYGRFDSRGLREKVPLTKELKDYTVQID